MHTTLQKDTPLSSLIGKIKGACKSPQNLKGDITMIFGTPYIIIMGAAAALLLTCAAVWLYANRNNTADDSAECPAEYNRETEYYNGK